MRQGEHSADRQTDTHMHKRTLMTSLSIVVRRTVDLMWIITLIIYERCSSACAQINCAHTNASKCIFGAEEIPFLGFFIGKRGLRADPAKVRAIVDWPVPKNQRDLRKWLDLANDLHKYSANYADMARPLSNLLKEDVDWCWGNTEHDAFQAVKESHLHAPILSLPNPDRPFSVVCDASDFAIGSALLQTDVDGRERVIAFEYR